jgi:prepilin-type N-terminal cleavage/methylation domain-containing protein
MKQFSNRRGLTFIECLISLVILGVGIVGVVGCMTAALISNQKASDIQLATAIGQNIIENMRSYGFGSVDYGDFPASINEDTTGSDDVEAVAEQLSHLHGGLATTAITDNYNGSARLKKVVVVVSWRSRNNQSAARVNLTSVIGNRARHTGS